MLLEIFSITTVILILLLLVDFREYYSNQDMYDYQRENPNALIHGKNISGTVYSDYPMSIPGLGWIL